MAFQNVGSSPRFYVSILQLLNSLGKLEFAASDWDISGKDPLSIADINPSSIATFKKDGAGSNDTLIAFDSKDGKFKDLMPDGNNFFMALGHTFYASNVASYSMVEHGEDYSPLADDPYVNYGDSGSLSSTWEGFSIGLGNNAGDATTASISLRFLEYNNFDFNLGSLLYGTYYDIDAPNLSLTMSREYGGTKEITTHNGSSISNTMWDKPATWGFGQGVNYNMKGGSWEFTTADEFANLSKSGRRTWQLKFSYMDDSDLWGSNQSLVTDYNDTTNIKTILTDNNFFSQVWHKTLGGTLPFVFQQDSSNNKNPDQFAICRFKNNSLKATQSAHGVYDISLSIEEVW